MEATQVSVDGRMGEENGVLFSSTKEILTFVHLENIMPLC